MCARIVLIDYGKGDIIVNHKVIWGLEMFVCVCLYNI